MASVVFIIRVPFEENREKLKTGEGGENQHENLKDNKEEGINRQNDEENSGKNGIGVKFEKSNEKNVIGDEVEPRDDTEADQTAHDVETLTDLNLAEVLQHELRALNVQGDSWTITNDEQFHQVIFLVKAKKIEKILERLTHVGVGKRSKTSVSIIPTSVHIQPSKNENVSGKRVSKCESGTIITETDGHAQSVTEPLIANGKESMKDQFLKSIKSRLTVEQVVEGVRTQANLTFDFAMFTVLASVIAAVGLVENNAVVLVASMLISPLMGPILGGTFGMVIKNKSLRNAGVKTELCGLTISLVAGFLFGFICGPFRLNGASWNSMKDIWPTSEMSGRGMTRSLWVGILIALPSGAGVALSVLGGNAGSLVGVAISASLLPPIVNSGILWAYSIITAIRPPELLDNGVYNNSTSKCPPFKDNNYIPTYSCDVATEAAIMAVLSLVLTLVNIICIFMTATIVLKIKEVTPKASSSNAVQTFWTKDVKVAREAYETCKGDQAQDLLKQWKEVQDRTKGSRDSLLEDVELLNIVEEVEKTDEFEYVVRRAPRGAQNLNKFSRTLKRLVSGEDDDGAIQNQLRNLQTYYTVHTQGKEKSSHAATIFSDSEIKANNEKPQQKIREFHVVDTENPHHTSVVRVQGPSDQSETYSVKTESGV